MDAHDTPASAVTIGGYAPGDLGQITALHGAWYAEHWRFGLFFEAKVAREMADFLERLDPARDGLWVARHAQPADGAPHVLGGITIDGSGTPEAGARVRWFILHPAARGLGVGHRLMGEAMAFCRAAGFRRVYLHTFAGLDAARHLYEAHGFTLCHEAEDSTWGTPVREQEFEWLAG